MSGMKVSELDFIRLLPAFMSDDEAAIALSNAMNKLLGVPGTRLSTLRTWDKIDELNESECDELAWELDVDWYDANMALEVKRATLKIVSIIKSKRGTKWAVEQLLATAFGGGKIEEWFEYGGEPFYFKTNVTSKPPLSISRTGYETFLSSINAVKSKRSHVDAAVFSRSVQTNLYFGAAVIKTFRKFSVPAAHLPDEERGFN